MLRAVLALVAVTGLAIANICTTNQGNWSFAIDDGVTDFDHGGVPLNKSFYCFEGCLNTATAVQNYKVKLAGSKPKLIERSRSRADVAAKLARPDDPNADTCIDPVLRQDVANALNKTTQPNCKGIVKSLIFNLNRPGWAINCVKFNAFGLDGIFQDNNFCDYDAFMFGEIYNVRLAALDMS